MDSEVLGDQRETKKKAKNEAQSSMPEYSTINRRTLPPLGSPPQPDIQPISNDPVNDESPVKKRRRKKKAVAAGSQEALVDNDEGTVPPLDTSNNAPKRRRKKRARDSDADNANSNIGLATELYDLNEDVIMSTAQLNANNDNDNVENRTRRDATEMYNTGATVAVMKSEPTDKLFIERRNGFKVADKSKVAQRRAEDDQRRTALAEQMAAEAEIQSTVDVALFLHQGVKRIYTFMRGMLAGICLWQIISTFMLLIQGYSVFLGGYFMLASPVQCLYFMLFAVSTVSVLDRFDPLRPNRICMIQSVSCQIGTVALLFYFIGLIFSVSTAFLDERISLYNANPKLWNNTDTNNLILYQWSILNLIRGVMAILGFIMICFTRPIDRLKESLYLADENILSLDRSTSQNNPPLTGTTGRMGTAQGNSLA